MPFVDATVPGAFVQVWRTRPSWASTHQSAPCPTSLNSRSTWSPVPLRPAPRPRATTTAALDPAVRLTGSTGATTPTVDRPRPDDPDAGVDDRELRDGIVQHRAGDQRLPRPGRTRPPVRGVEPHSRTRWRTGSAAMDSNGPDTESTATTGSDPAHARARWPLATGQEQLSARTVPPLTDPARCSVAVGTRVTASKAVTRVGTRYRLITKTVEPPGSATTITDCGSGRAGERGRLEQVR